MVGRYLFRSRRCKKNDFIPVVSGPDPLRHSYSVADRVPSTGYLGPPLLEQSISKVVL